MAPDITGTAGAVFPLLPEITRAVAIIIILPAHTSTVALQAITGMVASVWQAVMKVQVGQIQQPGPEAIVNPLQAAAVPIPIGIMAVVLAALPHTQAPDLHPPTLPDIILQPVLVPKEPATVANGLIGPPAPADPAAIPIPVLLTPNLPLALARPDLTG